MIFMPYLLYIIIAVITTIILGAVGIPMAKKYKAHQSIREEGPKSHRCKSGTPTMGGLFMVLAAVIVTVFSQAHSWAVICLLALTVGYCILGFLDDFIKAEKKRNLGLTAKQKLMGQIILAVIFCYGTSTALNLSHAILVPFTSWELSIGYLYYPFVVIVIVGASNAVNLTDGLDGLAAGCCFITFMAYALYSLWVGLTDVAAFSCIMAGCCAGFLFYNYHPAKIFMGDTGSLALGGAIAGISVVTHSELLLVFLGVIFVAEALSVILQVASFQLWGKRIFKMSPLHHHFELSGWSETQVVWFFWFTEMLAAAGVLLLVSICEMI